MKKKYWQKGVTDIDSYKLYFSSKAALNMHVNLCRTEEERACFPGHPQQDLPLEKERLYYPVYAPQYHPGYAPQSSLSHAGSLCHKRGFFSQPPQPGNAFIRYGLQLRWWWRGEGVMLSPTPSAITSSSDNRFTCALQ